MDLGDNMPLGCLGSFVLILMLLIVAAAVVLPAVQNLQDSAADAAQARAYEIRAQADLEYTREVAWEQRFMTWTAYLEHSGSGGNGLAVVLGAVLGMVTAVPVIVGLGWLARRRGWF